MSRSRQGRRSRKSQWSRAARSPCTRAWWSSFGRCCACTSAVRHYSIGDYRNADLVKIHIGYGPPPRELLEGLSRHRWALDGFELRRVQSIPELDDPCGRYLTFRQLIECGETQAAKGLANRPQRAESYNALFDLAVQVLDPVIDWFGMIRLTYGFCSPELARAIPGRIDPRRDQHAACELNRRGRPICE